MSVWLVSVPNEGNSSSETTFLSLKAETASSRHDYADCVRVELPSDLLVGTLDSLMALSDDLNRVDLVIESVVRKIERQFHDLNKGDQALTVDGVPVERYLSFFSWDEAKHPHRRPLPEIVSIIQSSVGKIEDELKQLSTRYAEKKQQLIGLQRKKGGNLMVANLNDVLTPDVVSTSDFVNTEYLQTMVVIVPKNLEEQWLQEYAQIGDQIAEYGPKGNRGNVRGSPVVPGSSRKLMEEGDSAVYTVTLLKGQYQPGFVDKEGNFEPGTSVDYIEDFKTRAKEKRFVVREFNFDPTSHASNEEAIAELEVEVDRLWSALIRWCKAHFGETFIAWMHIKMVRVFVESVLRYGLPVNFVVAMYKPHSGKDKKLRAVLSKKYAHLQPAQFSGLEEGSSGSSQVEYYPYVTNAFHPLSTT
ncbi:H - or Na -translocating F-type, V-type and A-type ATPase (F-ATPase) Superfamily [Phytophthora cinnamomi]|uniref:H - or Na -translocating F-type, V-type and A-type ATPase (F-ATPase) Superfamily n=1 Tax=Phytophthora cinnamomi TaxID=4785 RepID=UPI00355A9C1E|nr:H - or Na -translocating F-type, V-type and A-type ATPase (F-ATPase) Superfamily [Phytophthora cinnamomi]